MDFYKGKIPIITQSLNEGFVRGAPDFEPSTGAVPRDFSVDPVEVGDSPTGIKVFNRSEWDALFDRGDAEKDTLEHVYLRAAEAGQFEYLDQDGFPDCWFHSTAHALMLNRLLQNLPYVKMNAVAGATLMNRTNGGWCGLSMKYIREHGCPVVGGGPGEWPYQSRRGRDTPELRASIARYKSLEDWYDLGRAEYDQKETVAQIHGATEANCPTPSDYYRFGHSMLTLRWVRIEANSWGPLTLNSWQGFGYHGLCVLRDMAPDNACSLRTSTPSS